MTWQGTQGAEISSQGLNFLLLILDARAWETLRFHSSSLASLFLRCLCLVGITGVWPVCLFYGSGLPLCLDYCPACGEQSVTVIHAFDQCPATQCVIDEASSALNLPDRSRDQRLLLGPPRGPNCGVLRPCNWIGSVAGTCRHSFILLGTFPNPNIQVHGN